MASSLKHEKLWPERDECATAEKLYYESKNQVVSKDCQNLQELSEPGESDVEASLIVGSEPSSHRKRKRKRLPKTIRNNPQQDVGVSLSMTSFLVHEKPWPERNECATAEKLYYESKNQVVYRDCRNPQEVGGVSLSLSSSLAHEKLWPERNECATAEKLYYELKNQVVSKDFQNLQELSEPGESDVEASLIVGSEPSSRRKKKRKRLPKTIRNNPQLDVGVFLSMASSLVHEKPWPGSDECATAEKLYYDTKNQVAYKDFKHLQELSEPGKSDVEASLKVGSEPSSRKSRTIFSRTGRDGIVTKLIGNDCGLISYESYNVLFYRENCYIDGFFSDESMSKKTVGSVVRFEAILLDEQHSSGADYLALSVWQGEKPSLRKRWQLETGKMSPLVEKNVKGIIAKLALPVAALALVGDVKVLIMLKNVIADIKNLRLVPIISSVLKIGDLVEMKVMQRCATWPPYGVKVKVCSPSPVPLSPCKPLAKLASEIRKKVSDLKLPFCHGKGKLGLKLSDSDAIFIVQSPQTTYAVYVLKRHIFLNGKHCDSFEDVSDVEFTVASYSCDSLPPVAVLCDATQHSAYVFTGKWNSKYIDYHKCVLSEPLKQNKFYIGDVKETVSYGAVIVEVRHNGETVPILVHIKALKVDGDLKKKNRMFIGSLLKVGDKVCLQPKEEKQDGCFMYTAFTAQKGESSKGLSLEPLHNQAGLNSVNAVSSIAESNSTQHQLVEALDEICNKLSNTKLQLDTPSSQSNSGRLNDLPRASFIANQRSKVVSTKSYNNGSSMECVMSQCFSKLYQMSGDVTSIRSRSQGVVSVHVLKLEVEFSVDEFVFWRNTESERKKPLSELAPLGTLLMFNASKVRCDGKIVFRATKVWKPSVPTSDNK